MKTTTRIYHLLKPAYARFIEATRPIEMWMGYAQAIPKNRAYTALWLGPRVFAGLMILGLLIAIVL
jgi:hypothetical protein